MARPVLALLTDFGVHDHYVAVMKAVALAIQPELTFVDITHDITPQDVAAAAFELEAAYPYFPRGTVFLVVIDPGVGTTRRGVAVDIGDYRFVGPDNGVLSLVLDAHPSPAAVEIVEPKYMRSTVSRTFEGRDRFAPAAAWLATGLALTALGPAVYDLKRLVLPIARQEGDRVTGEIVPIDRFGNLITNVPRELVTRLGSEAGVVIGGARLAGVVSTYGDVADGALCALVGSSDRLEIAVRNGSAHNLLGVGCGTAVHLQRGA